MGFAGAAVADEDDRLRPLDITARGEFVDLLRRDPRTLREIELLQQLHPRQTRFADAPLHQSLFAFQRFEEAQM